MSNILKAFINIINNHQADINDITKGNNKANNIGEGLEAYIKDIFANTVNETNEQVKLRKLFTLITQ